MSHPFGWLILFGVNRHDDDLLEIPADFVDEIKTSEGQGGRPRKEREQRPVGVLLGITSEASGEA